VSDVSGQYPLVCLCRGETCNEQYPSNLRIYTIIIYLSDLLDTMKSSNCTVQDFLTVEESVSEGEIR
jgi:hypothetical protein